MCECVDYETTEGWRRDLCEVCTPEYWAALKVLKAGIFRRLWWRLFGDPLSDIWKDGADA